MEFHAGIVFIGCIVVVILVVIFISLFGIREKTYEEAIAEQKRKAQETALQSKSEKTVKEKKKKYTRKSKDKPDKGGDNEEEIGDHVPSKTSSEELNEQRTKNNNLEKKSKQFNSLKRQNLSGGGDSKDQVNARDVKENCELEVEKEIIQEQVKSELNTESIKEDKEELKHKNNKVNGAEENKAKEEAKMKNKSKEDTKPKAEKAKDAVKLDAKTKEEKAKEEPVVKKEEAQTVTSPAKKSKKQKTDQILGEVALNGTKVVSIVKNAMLTDVEIHTLIDVLLNKQQEGEIWMKPGQKIDPVSALKKQLQEKEQALADEHQLAQAANNKLKELRQELGNEKSRFSQVERSLREKLASQQQEIQNMQRHYQHSHEQQLSEINALQVKFQQVQAKLDEDNRLTIQQLQEENQQLQHTITRLENEVKSVNTNEISRLEQEVEQLRSNESQYQIKEAASHQSQEELQNHVHQLTQHVQELENEKIQLNEVVRQLQQKEIELEELQRNTQELQNLESANALLRNEISGLTTTKSLYEQKIVDLEAKVKEQDNLQIAVNENSKRVQEKDQEVEKLNMEKRDISDKMDRITEELRNKENSIKEMQETNTNHIAEINRLQQEIEVQKQRNNEKEVHERRNTEESMKKMFERIFPSVQVQPDLSFNDWLGSIEHEATQHIASLNKCIEDSDCSRELAESKETQNVLNAQIQQYKSVLAETENMLTQLQNKVEEEEHKWKERLVSKEKEIDQLQEEKQLLKEKQIKLEKSLEQVTSAEEAAAELQEKLKLLQQKLQGEENERRQLEVKYDEAFKNVSDLQNILNETQKELQEAKTEKNCVESLKKDLDEIQIQLDTEKKVAKDLRSENVKLNSLVKIGQDSVNAEQERVKALEKELSELKNRSTNGSPCQPTNHIEDACDEQQTNA